MIAMALHGYVRGSDADLWELSGSRAITMHAETDLRRPTRLADRVIGATLLHQLQEGDTLIVGTLADLVDFPSDAVKIVRALAGRGVTLKILEPGDIAAAARTFEPLEHELGRAKAELSQVQEIADARVQAARKEIMKQMLDVYGPPDAWATGMPNGAGDVHKPLAAGTLGDALRKRREALGLSQSQLADASGVSQTTISRAESNKMPAPERLLAFLFDQDDQPQPHTGDA